MTYCGVKISSVRGVLLGALLTVFMCACSPKGNKSIANSLESVQCVDLADTLRVDTLNFGRVRKGDTVFRTFAIGNSSNAPIVVTGTETGCGCLNLDYPKNPVAAGARAEATMKFYSSGYNYFPPRSFYIRTTYSDIPHQIVVIADIVE